MNIDFTEFEKAMKNIGEAAKLIVENLRDVFDLVQATYKELVKVNVKRKKYKPMLKIRPNKSIILDKRLINYYCRNSC